MKLFVFSIMDKAVGAFLPPFCARSKGEAIRMFTDAANSKDSQFNKYPMDYLLVELGDWDDSSGVFKCGDPIRVLAAHEVVEGEPFTAENKAVNGGRPLPM